MQWRYSTEMDPRHPSNPQKTADEAQARCEAAAAEPHPDTEGVVTSMNGKDPKEILCADAAEISVPRYLITWKDSNGKETTARAFKGETKGEDGKPVSDSDLANGNKKVYKAVSFRHKYSTSVLVLLAMLAGLIGAVLLILLKRDKDPQ
jgi:hypothetical protein